MHHSMGVSNRIFPPYIVASQLKILTPVGRPTTIEATAKNMFDAVDIPMVNMWCAQTADDTVPIPTVAPIIAARPKIGLREKTGMISDAQAKPGSIRT